MIHLIAAVSENKAIGKQGKIPWYLQNDLAHFKALTLNHTVMMGRKTLDSIGRALPNRRNIVLSQSGNILIPDIEVVSDFHSAITLAQSFDTDIFIIGGESLYREGLEIAHRIYLTQVHTVIENADAFFPAYSASNWIETSRKDFSKDEKNEFDYSFLVLERQ